MIYSTMSSTRWSRAKISSTETVCIRINWGRAGELGPAGCHRARSQYRVLISIKIECKWWNLKKHTTLKKLTWPVDKNTPQWAREDCASSNSKRQSRADSSINPVNILDLIIKRKDRRTWIRSGTNLRKISILARCSRKGKFWDISVLCTKAIPLRAILNGKFSNQKKSSINSMIPKKVSGW